MHSLCANGVTHRKKKNETYAMIAKSNKTNKFTAYPLCQKQLPNEKNVNIVKPYQDYMKIIESTYSKLFGTKINMNRLFIANVRDGADKEKITLPAKRTTVCGAHFLNHLGKALQLFMTLT